MSATVTYKGSTLTTAENQTRTLKTAGKYLEGDITITDVTAGGEDHVVVVTDTTDVHGGTIREITATEQNLQTKSVTPSESAQTITADTGYTGLEEVDVAAVSSTYVGSGITRRSSTDLTASGATVTVPAGYYASQASKAVSNGTAGTPTATKGTVSNHSVSVTPSVTNTSGYIAGSTKTGTAVTVSASELVSGSETKTENGTYNVTNLAELVVNVESGGTGLKVESVAKTVTSASSSIQFTGLNGEPTSFVVTSSANLSTGSSPYKTAAVVFNGTSVIGQYITNASNAQMTYDDEHFSKSYSNGTLTITGTNSNFQANEYVLVYSYGGTSANIETEQVQVGSGATSITFTGLSDEPTYFSCLFTSDIGTSSGYTRTHAVVFDGSSIYGMEMGLESSATEHWTYTYSNGSLTISSQSTSAGGYFHQPGYYQLTYAVGGEIELTTEPLNVTVNGTYTAPRGKAYTPVTVSVSGGGGSVSVETLTTTIDASAASIQFAGLKGTPKYWFLRTTTQISSSGSTTYYYVIDARYNGTNTTGNSFRIGSTRRIYNVTTGLSYSYSNGTITISSNSANTASPGYFYVGSYELVYIY